MSFSYEKSSSKLSNPTNDFLPKRAVTLVLSILAGLMGCSRSEPPLDMTDPGQLIFLGYAKEDVNCSKCHGADGRGGMQAPDIRDVFTKYEEEVILDIIEFGKGEGTSSMPPFEGKITEEELQTLLRFLKTLQSNSATRAESKRDCNCIR